jgi:mRNA interferase MazF
MQHVARHTYTGEADDMERKVSRGDVYFLGSCPATGSEQRGRRPVLVIQNNAGNEHSPTIIVAAITSERKVALPTHLPLDGMAGLRPGSMALLEQLRTIDKNWLDRYMGTLGSVAMGLVDAALAISVGLCGKTRTRTVITLCSRCLSDYLDQGHFAVQRVRRSKSLKEPCTKCSVRMGYDYKVIELNP